jgi:hypothetical protein
MLLAAAATGHPLEPEGACDARAASVVVGRAATRAVEAKAKKLSGARIVRTIRPGSAYTMDFRPDRLNIHVDRRGRIGRLACS